MDVNYIAVLVSSVIVMIIGYFWYSPYLFENLWLKLSKISKKDLEKSKKKGMSKSLLISFIATLLTAYVLENLIEFGGYTGFFPGIVVGFIVWLGFIATVMLNSVLWEGQSVQLYLLNSLHQLIIFIVMGGILGAW